MLSETVKQWMDAHREEFIKDLTDLIAIPSISCAPKDSGDPEAPYGPACRAVLDFMLELGQKYGFDTENIGNRVGRVIYSPETEKDIGVWGHLDVVEPGLNWLQEDPFRLQLIQDDFAVGRGVRDNKGPTLAVLYALRCLKDLNVKVDRGLSLYMGCSEETGLNDVLWFVQSGQRCPHWSLVADSAWPMHRGEKGSLSVDLYSGKGFSSDVLELVGGVADSSMPAHAHVILSKAVADVSAISGDAFTVEETEAGVKISAKGKACHTAFPMGGINAIGLLAGQMLRQPTLCAQDRELWEQIHAWCSVHDGSPAGVDVNHPEEGNLTCVATTLKPQEDGTLKLHLNIRFPAVTTVATVQSGLEAWAQANGWRLDVLRAMEAYSIRADHPMVVTLLKTYNDIMETNKKAIILAGGTYASKLPNGVGYGMGGAIPAGVDKLMPPGHGHPHGPDECGRISLMLEGAGIYTEALTRLADLKD